MERNDFLSKYPNFYEWLMCFNAYSDSDNLDEDYIINRHYNYKDPDSEKKALQQAIMVSELEPLPIETIENILEFSWDIPLKEWLNIFITKLSNKIHELQN